MDNKNEPQLTESASLLFMIGEVRSDVKHILVAQKEQRHEISRVEHDLENKITSVSTRVTNLEQWKWKLIGAITVGAPVVSTGLTIVLKKLGVL